MPDSLIVQVKKPKKAQETPSFPVANFPTEFRCVGIVKAQYFPSTDIGRGLLLFSDGKKFPASIQKGVVRYLGKHPELIGTPQLFSVWLRQNKYEDAASPLNISITKVHHYDDEAQQRKILEALANKVQIRGVVTKCEEDKVTVQVRRNLEAPDKEAAKMRQWKPFYLDLVGGSRLGVVKPFSFWEVECSLNKEGELLIEKGKFVQDIPKGFKHVKLKQHINPKQAKQLSFQKLNQQQLEATKVQGRLELTIKINELPKAKKVQTGWQFAVECGEQLVTVTLKEKVWNKLVKASQDYPAWVCAIGGVMGEKSEKGFVLNNPAIQVFEKKIRETEQKEEAIA